MKTYAALALLSLTLAACSQQATPATQSASSAIGTTAQGQTFANTQAAQEAQITAELKALGLDGGVSAQAVAPQVYLNVLPVPTSADSVRAYVKSTFTSPVTCSVTWGDGSTSTSVASPTLGRIETQDHAYATFGTYTITVTCRNGASVVGTQSMTVQAGKKANSNTVISFDTPAAPDGSLYHYETFEEQGFSFSGDSLGTFATNFGGEGDFNWGSSQSLYSYNYGSALNMRQNDGELFTLKSVDVRYVHHGYTADFIIIGHKPDGSTVSATTQQIADAGSTLTFDGSWTGLDFVTFGQSYREFLIDNVTLSK